jgi:hypothetical protein
MRAHLGHLKSRLFNVNTICVRKEGSASLKEMFYSDEMFIRPLFQPKCNEKRSL